MNQARKYAGGYVFATITFLFAFIIQFLRFYSIDTAPPGFYVDEATGAAEVMCLKQTGHDYFGNSYPLFSPSLGGGFYTPAYLYGQYLWTSVFGDSTTAYRSFIALITMLTIFIFFAFLRRFVGASIALWFLILASISPWAFQFSRIAWDPPLAVFFLALAIWVFTAGKKWSSWLGGIFFAAAAYSYPPTRAQAGVFLLLMPGVSWKETFKAIGAFGVALIPLLLRSMDADFKLRANLVGIWSSYDGNPWKGASLPELAWGVFTNFLKHLTPDFLFLHGDANLRHSPQTFGLISYPEAAGILVGAIGLFRSKVRQALTPNELSLLWIALIGVITGLLPSAMTWESVPHALRSITAWPFFCMLGALGVAKLTAKPKHPLWKWTALAACMVFAYFYLNDYLNEYPSRAMAWFQTDHNQFGEAYERMRSGMSCEQVRVLPLQ
ncbi:MAG: glycosyltransferase family 39 protein [Bdellovibrionales bacterium]|nr:glycosyltransferase family 39 protein [Bdellovibrionales bacterium]